MSTVQQSLVDGLRERMFELGRAARAAAAVLAQTPSDVKRDILMTAARELRAARSAVLAANAEDVAEARARGASSATVDRLALDDKRLEATAAGLETVAALDDPVGRVVAEWQRPNGLMIARVRVPLGVIGIIYESRPNVTADAAALCLKSGNAAILRGGSESARSNAAIHACLARALAEHGLPETAVQMVPTQDREAVGIMLRDMAGFIDVIVPRGGKGLVARVQQDARVPGHEPSRRHLPYVRPCALRISRWPAASRKNAKLRRTGICGATETILIDRACVATHLQPIVKDLIDAGCEVRGDTRTQSSDARVRAAIDADWGKEFLDAIVAIRVVDGLDEALAHIRRYGSAHTDAIVTDDAAAAERFLNELDSAIVMHNASTQFADGGEFGMGAEIGIATGKIHARGPVGAAELTSYKYVVRGTGQIRP